MSEPRRAGFDGSMIAPAVVGLLIGVVAGTLLVGNVLAGLAIGVVLAISAVGRRYAAARMLAAREPEPAPPARGGKGPQPGKRPQGKRRR